MATVTIAKCPRKKTKDVYRVDFYNPETQKKEYYGTFKKKGDAKAAKAKLEVAIDGGEAIEVPRTNRSLRSKTVTHFCHIKEKEWKRRGQEGSLSPATTSDYIGRLKRIRKVFGKKIIGTITEELLLQFRAKEAHRNSPASANRYLFVIQQVMKQALKEKAITSDPAASIKKLNEKQHERKNFLTPKEVEILLAQAAKQKTRHYMVLAILLGLEHGCSRQEVLDLTWADIDLEFGDLGLIRFYRTKNKQERLHTIMPRTREALLKRKDHLEKMREKRSIKVEADYVAGRLNGTRLTNFNRAWRTIRDACSFKKKLNFHDHRHTYCTNIVLAGGSTKHAAAMIGHNDPRMTERYTNLENLIHNPVQDKLAAHCQNT
ncbi:tyrosine-type recombinase/integrase [Pseudodesulfovibrio piezophilus]|uniref:Putative Site-specific recombinase, phage integrase family n=1 Tax=Pseudodesulfovibrio piezophilus (strain DSM 21447 / JCM 15486 / C1TLV30) TaxID=1322246 RepID=M1WPQ8_PSEP2|nr:site-specific integrase [Pseudodesulfovibrio piezophilus]CCH48524.1 putative Site-specific recombinase, phage integrase family [Pseudodesulfovibrio piezophilus C1TLV30]